MVRLQKTKNRLHFASVANGASTFASVMDGLTTLTFCSSNMLYPKEDRNSNKLMFACRTCQFSEEAKSSCVFRNNLYNITGETAGVTQDVGSDPTVGFLDLCTLCGLEIGCLFCGAGDNSSLENDLTEDDILPEKIRWRRQERKEPVEDASHES